MSTKLNQLTLGHFNCFQIRLLSRLAVISSTALEAGTHLDVCNLQLLEQHLCLVQYYSLQALLAKSKVPQVAQSETALFHPEGTIREEKPCKRTFGFVTRGIFGLEILSEMNEHITIKT
jgi:hypothetical protein